MLAFKLFYRDLLAGGSTMLISCIVVAVTALTTVGLFTDRVRQAITQEAGESLAADIRIESDEPIQDSLLNTATSLGLTDANIINFRSVVMSNESSSLVDVRGVSQLYPLRGQMLVADSLTGTPYAIDEIPELGEVWAEPALLVRLGLDVGDMVMVGSLQATISQVLSFRPDEGWRFMEIAPTLLLNIEDIEHTQLVLPGSRVEYELLLSGSEGQLNQFSSLSSVLLLPGQEVDDISDARPEVRASLVRAEQFLHLSALITVILCGISIMMASNEFVSRHEKTVAILRVFGSKYQNILKIIATQLLLLVAVSTIIGLAIGWLCQFLLASIGSNLIEAYLPNPSIESILIGPLTSIFVTMGFAFLPMLSLKDVSPMRLLRSDIPTRQKSIWAYLLVITASLIFLLNILLGDTQLLLMVVLVIVTSTLILMLASFLLVRFSICIKPFFTGSIRYGISNISRRSMHSTIQLIAFGLGVTAVLILTIVRTQLLDTWQSSLPDQTPNFFLINIQSGEEATIKSILSEYSVDAPAFYPIARGRISHVNDIALSDYDAVNEEAEDELRDDINLTWSSSFPVGNELIEGRWWDDNESPQISIAERLLDEIGLSLGDDLTFYLSGQSLTAKITSVRRVDWESFRPNFFMLMNPGFLERLPYTSITSFYLEDVQARQAIMELTDQLPSISSIDIGAVIAQVRSAMQQASLAVQFVFLFTLISAFLVMLTTLHATKRDRIYEGSLIKAIGGNTKTVRTSLLVEFVVIGSLAGLLGSIIAVASGYLLATEVFNIEYQLNWLILPAGICGGGALVGLASLFITRSISSKQPSLLLRESYD